jgi:hypothetical protein
MVHHGTRMQPGQQPPQGFQWDSTGASAAAPAPQILQGTMQPIANVGAYGQHQIPMQQPSTSATAAMVISILVLIVGFLTTGVGCCFAPIPLLMANSALKTTSMYPGHSDHGTAKAAQIISAIMTGLLLVSVVIFLLLALTFNGI